MAKDAALIHNTDFDRYIQAATRDNTRKSYRSAVEHFEVAFGGRLPTTSDTICRYLAHYAPTLAFNTLKIPLGRPVSVAPNPRLC
tara:strand:+ start:462 stop:716 length:255 start_codon:yes stop_codon:yes gene_type:complete